MGYTLGISRGTSHLQKAEPCHCPADHLSSFPASMEMNESSRWTEEEMETAKKGECAATPSCVTLGLALGAQALCWKWGSHAQL
jgi:hypothetical protein